MPQLTGNVFIETGFQGCNPSFVVTSEGVVMVDSPQLPTEAVRWRDEIARHGPVRFLLHSEHHGDHITGDYFFPTTVVAQQFVREAYAASLGGPEAVRERVQQMDPQGLPLVENYQMRLPTITFTQRLTLYVGEHTFELIHLPGHTPGQTAIFVPQERVVFTGDNVVYRRQPFLFQCQIFDWMESLKRLGELEVDHIIPGHGEACDRSYLAEFGAFLQDWVAAVEKAIDQGWSREEVMERISFLDRYPMNPGREAFGPELQRNNASRLYDELMARRRA